MGQRITFHPAPTGKAVTVTTPRSSGSTPNWGGVTGGGGTGGATLTISVERGQQKVAPEGIRFNATVEGFDAPPPAEGGIYDSKQHDIYYTWTFGDPGEHAHYENMLPQWRDRNVGYGPFPAHVFATPGTYTVICTAYEPSSGKSASASYDVTVQDPEVVFTSATTVCVDPDGDFTGAPTTEPLNRVTTAAAAWSRWGALGSVPKRILFRAGKTFPLDAAWGLSGAYNTYFSTWGGTEYATLVSGPAITAGSIIFVSYNMAVQGASISNLHIKGPWDAENTASMTALPPGGLGCGGGFATVHNVWVEGCSTCFGAGRDNKPNRTTILSQIKASGWNNFGMYGDGENHAGTTGQPSGYTAVLGYVATQKPYATQNGGNRGGLDNDHGPYRMQMIGTVYMDGMEAFSRNGWGTNASNEVPADQPVLRHHANDPRCKAFYTRIMGEGGHGMVTFADATGAGLNEPINIVLEKFYLLGTANTNKHLNLGNVSVTVRDGVFHRPDVKFGGQGYHNTVIIGEKPSAASFVDPIKIYNVTVVNEVVPAEYPQAWEPFLRNPYINASQIQIANNVIHQPNFPGGPTADAPLDGTRLGIPARYLGYRWHEFYAKGVLRAAVDPMDTSYANPVDPYALWTPLPGSAAIGSATGDLVSYTDMFGTVRGASPSRGAVEPAA